MIPNEFLHPGWRLLGHEYTQRALHWSLCMARMRYAQGSGRIAPNWIARFRLAFAAADARFGAKLRADKFRPPLLPREVAYSQNCHLESEGCCCPTAAS